MSYISAIRTGDDVLVWERNENGRELKTFRAPYYFYTKSEDGEYTSLYGDKLTRHDFKIAPEFQQARNDKTSSGIEMFESDIPPELKILSQYYYDVPAPVLNISLFDIEVDYDKNVGFASESNPYAPINSVAIYHTHQKRYVVLAVPPNLAPVKPTEGQFIPGDAPQEFIKEMSEIAPFQEGFDLDVIFCRDEKELLFYFLVEIEDSDVISGWNSDVFDVAYLGRRLEKLGKKYLKRLSFPEAKSPTWREAEIFGNKYNLLDLSGRISADYMVLFKKYEVSERPSYKLESIAAEILPDLPKLEYEGSLADLYRDNFAYFVRYNIRDTEILQGFEDRLGYIDLANQMMHLSTGVWKHVTGTLKLAELAVINYCHHVLGGLIVNDFTENSGSGIQGAFVLLPQIGMHENIGSIDINSLYPSSIRAINISPEMLLGQFTGEVKDAEEIAKGSLAKITLEFDDATQVPEELRGQVVEKTADEWRELFIENKWAVSGFGTVFTQQKQGTIPMILEDWYATRKKYQKMKGEAKSKGDTIKATYYDKLQYTYKIKLNSFYGALTNPYFRFFDNRMGASTTGTGRMILLHQCAKACEILDGEYMLPDRREVEEDGSEHLGYTDKWSVVYGDTDSSYFRMPHTTPKKAVELADGIGEIVNDSFQEFMKETFLCTPGFDDKIKCGREIVSDRGIFVQKKRYILHIIDNEGEKVDKLKVMGLDTKKTTLPKEVSDKLNAFIGRLLKGEEWDKIAKDIVEYKDYIATTNDIMAIGLPKGVKGVEKYTNELRVYGDGARLPGHVAASILYNMCLEQFNDKASMNIISGTKIKVFYLTAKVGRFKSIAIPVDIEQVPKWFIEEFKVDREAHIERLVDNPLKNILKAIGKDVPSKQGLVVDSLLDF